MHVRAHSHRAGAAVLGLALAFACAGAPGTAPEEPAGAGLAAAPVWILQDCAAWWGDDARHHLCGVGSAVGPANPSLQRSTAVGRGRTEVARQVHGRLQTLLAELDGPWDVVDTSKRISDALLPGTAVAETWVSPHGTLYALVALDVGTFSETVRGMADLPAALRETVLARADRVFARPAAPPRAAAEAP